MRTAIAAIAAIAVSIVVLSGTGMGQAADIVQADTQKQVSKPEYSKPAGRVVLTDDQMNKITAGHLTWPGDPNPHWGLYRDPITGEIRYGLHQDFDPGTSLRVMSLPH
jgi:hypothetical protein